MWKANEFQSLLKGLWKGIEGYIYDIAKSIKAENELKTLRIIGSNIDTYIATFTKLIKLADYEETKYEALTLFK